ncbi:PKD repeat protein [Kitasatospora sp. MAP12-15]|uniref:PKD domain-containing protein n=1 Tax=unclassified Kitasatospora TaxID=2633591 RepID=UPI003512F310
MPVRRHVGLAAAIVSSAILGSALPAFVVQADPTTLYVNNTPTTPCTDGGTGTQARPFCTVQAAANAAQPGQTVQIAPGNYQEQVTVTHSGTPGHPITFQGSQYAYDKTSTSTIGVFGNSGDAQTLPHAFVLSGVHDVTVTDLELRAQQEAVLVSDSDRIIVNGNTLDSLLYGVTPSAPGIRLTGKTTASTVSRNTIYLGVSGVAVDAGVTGAVVTTNLISSGGAGVTVTDAPGTAVTSNTIDASCSTSVVLAGNSANSTIENNIAVAGTSQCAAQPDLVVSAASVSGTRVDYNLVSQASGKVNYAWADATYTSPAAFAAATGQGSHDIASASRYPNIPAAIDSADATAPGELATDMYGNPRVDDPLVANTGTGVGYYDRGAFELQDPVWATITGQPTLATGHPLDAAVQVAVNNASWGPVTGTVDFGDGSPKATSVTGSTQLTHTYPGPGTYTLSLTIADGTATRTATGTVTIQPLWPLAASVSAWQPDWSVPREQITEAVGSPWPVTKFVVDFGDGSPKVENSGPLAPAPFMHTYPGLGTYTATLTVTDDHGRSVTTSQPVRVGVLLPLNRTIETAYNGSLMEASSDSLGWHQGSGSSQFFGAGPVSAMDFSFSPSGGRVIEAIEGGVLHEIYSAPDRWHDTAIQGVGANATALSFSYSPSGGRVIEAIEGGVLHEIYSAPDGWHDGAIQGVAPNATALSFSYSPSGGRVIEAVENGVLHEVYSAADGWHDAVVPGAGAGIKSLSLKFRPTGDRVIEAVENDSMAHEIYTNAGTWRDSITPIDLGFLTSVSLGLR